MNLIKKFVRTDNAEDNALDDEVIYDPGYGYDYGEEEKAPVDDPIANTAAPAPAPEKVSVKLLQPKSHTEATKIADKLKENCIVLLDISNLAKEQARRLVDFLAGVAYVLGGEMIKTNKNTIVVSPAGVDISGFAPDASPEEVEQPAEEAAEETYGEIEEVPEEIPEEV